MDKPFNEFDQSVPAPEFGAGVVLHYTHKDLREVEAYAKRKLVSEDTPELVRSVFGAWDFIQFFLDQRQIDVSEPVLTIGLKNPDGTRLNPDWDNPPKRMNFTKLTAAASVAILASLNGQTLDEAIAAKEKVKADAARPKVAQEVGGI